MCLIRFNKAVSQNSELPIHTVSLKPKNQLQQKALKADQQDNRQDLN